MLLSRLEISGFKSFPEKTTIEFDGGITGVVGPNGCGKSNILDSIRWVLGEQRTGILRSSRMEQMIFSGTSTLKPTGMAEVTLIIKNNRGLLPLEYDDISITRRLYRSGESEYLINKNICRLKDIIELFFDTGMGAHAYSVIQQGMIDSILSDKTEDRRSLFEEAAGVTKYKHRKKEAENRLAATEADLLRLADIIAEIEKQVVMLRRQARRAGRYAEQKELLKETECILCAARIFESGKQYDELSGKKKDLSTEIESSIAEIDSLQANLQEKKINLTELEKAASAFRQKDSELAMKAAGFENEIKLSEHRAEVSGAEIKSCEAEIAALEKRIEALNGNIEQNQVKLTELESQKRLSSERCDNLEQELEELSTRLKIAESELEDRRKSRISVSEKISGVRTEIAYLDETRKNLTEKLGRLEEDSRGYDRLRDESSVDLGNLEKQSVQIASRIEQMQKHHDSLLKQKEMTVNTLAEYRDNLALLQAERSGLEARRELFEQMIETGEGFSSGAAALRSWSGKPSGIYSPLAEVLEVPEKYRVAVAAALGDMGEIIPVAEYSDAYAAIEYLKSNSGGRASFLVLSEINAYGANIDRPAGTPGSIGYLDEMVSCPAEYANVVRLLLGRVGLFSSKDSAVGAPDRWNQFTKVTLDGLVLLPSGFVSGGKTSTGVLGRRQDLAAVKDRLSTVDADMEAVLRQISDKQRSVEDLNESIARAEAEIIEQEDDYNRIGAEFNQLKFDFKERENRHSSARNEAEGLRAELEKYNNRGKLLSDELISLENNSDAGSATLKEATNRVEELRTAIRDVEGNLTAARIRNVEIDGFSGRLNSEIEHSRELNSEASKMIESNRRSIEKASDAIIASGEKIESLKKALENCFSERNEARISLNAFEGEISEMMTNLTEIENKIAIKRKEKESRVSQFHSLEMRFLELDSARKSMMERLRLEFGVVSLEPAPLPDDQTIESLTQKAENIRESLKRMEPVNLMAAEDYERENDRFNFLTRQRDDLLEARTSLREAISRINTTAENRFNQTFGKIAGNFQRVFLSLFEGGEARVELENPDDPLESPIKISARPGGKKMLTVTQLSGGERALTAISLLFGIYLVKPSPFCVLDEIDAPLDDANLMRFLKLIKEFAHDTQFIIITHNKLTMEATDVLYGVTMQTPGVSKVVSVKFKSNGNGDNVAE